MVTETKTATAEIPTPAIANVKVAELAENGKVVASQFEVEMRAAWEPEACNAWIINNPAFIAQVAKDQIPSEVVRAAIDACRPLEHLRKVQDKNGEAGVHKIAVISFAPQHGTVANAVLLAGKMVRT